jgi:hypothetical protein
MLELLLKNPWLIPCALVAIVIVACTAIVFITEHLKTSRQSEIEAWLKQDMLNRGMSPEDIRTVLEARIDGEATRIALSADQGIRVGLGKFHVKVGSINEPTSAAGRR